MKEFLFVIVFACISLTCTNVKQKADKRSETASVKKDINKNQDENIIKQEKKKCNDFIFSYDTNNKNSFGVKIYPMEILGPSSYIIHDDFIYIVDVYHNNIKRFEYKINELKASKKLSDQNIWLNDIIVFNEKVYATSNLDSLYIFSLDLKLISRLRLNKGSGHFYKLYPDSLIIAYPTDNHKYITLNKDNEIINIANGFRSRAEISNGKLFKILGNDNVETKFGIKKINNLDLVLNNGLDYDSLIYVYCILDTTKFIINICEYD